MTSELLFSLQGRQNRSIAKRIAGFAPATARVLLGLLFFVSGLNGFLNFLPQPQVQLPSGAAAFMGALLSTGYMFQLIMATQLIVGVLLLSNCLVPLALLLLAPFVVNSIGFHVFLEPSGRPMAFLVLGFELFLAWKYRNSYRGVLALRATPATD